MTLDQIVAAINARIAALHDEQRQLNAAREALQDATRPRPARARRPVAARETVVVPLAKLLAVVDANPGETTTALAARTGGERAQLLALLKEAEADGQVRRKGERRATRWYRISDEDQIAARAAELEAQSAAAKSGA